MTTQHESPDALDQFAELLRDEYESPAGIEREGVDLEQRRRRRRRALIVVAVVVAVILGGSGGYVGWALNAPLSAPVVDAQAPPVPAPVAASIALPYGAASAIAVSGAEQYLDATGDEIWAAGGTADPVPMASITKLITALVVLDEVPLADAADPGPTLTFDRADHALYDKYYVMGATIAAMPIGSSMSLHDALATMLLPSACNYAEAIANWAFGSPWGFVRAAERWLEANGLTQTTVVEPTGIDPRNTSSASDLIALGRIAAANPAIVAITSTRSLDLPGPGSLVNTNTLLGVHGVTGLKTGTLDEIGSNLLYTATFGVGIGEPLEVVGVVLGGSSRSGVNDDVTELFESIDAGFRTVSLAELGDHVGSISTPWGAAADLVLGADAGLMVWSDTPVVAKMETTTPRAWADGEQLGSITWTAGPHTATVPILIDGDIELPDEWWRLTHPGELG